MQYRILVGGESTETDFSGDSSFNWVEQRLFKPLGSRGFRGECTSLTRARVLGIPYLHKEEFQVLARCDLIRREEVEHVT